MGGRTEIQPFKAFSQSSSQTSQTWSYNSATKKWTAGNLIVTSNCKGISGSETRGTVGTPGYTARSAYGRLPYNNFSYACTKTRWYMGYIYTDTGTSRSMIDGGRLTTKYPEYYGVSSLSSVTIANLKNQVKQKVLEKIKDQQVDIATALGERDQAIRMISNSIRNLANFAKALKNGNMRNAADVLGFVLPKNRAGKYDIAWAKNRALAFADAWLELEYGWLPTIADIEGAVEFLNKSARREYSLVSARKSLHDSSSQRIVLNTATLDIQNTSFCEVSCHVKMKRVSSLLADLSSLGLLNPAGLAWELTRFSFVVDWAVQIGAFLGQFSATCGFEFESGSLTVFTKDNLLGMESNPPVPPAGYVSYTVHGTWSVESISCNRSGLGSFSDLLHLPAFKDPRSLTHFANSLALLLQTFRGK